MKPVAADKGLGSKIAERSFRIDARRRRVLNAARRLFASYGFQNTRMTQISTEAGIKIGQIYRDFEDKNALILGLIEIHLDEILDRRGLEIATGTEGGAAVRGWILNFLHRDQDPAAARLLAHILFEASRNDQIASALQRADGSIRDCLARAIKHLAPIAPVADGQRLIDTVMTLLIGLPQRRIASPQIDFATLAGDISAVVEREMDRLVALQS